MKKIAILIVSAFAFIGCNNAAQTANTNAPAKTSDDSALVSGHSQAPAQNPAGASSGAPHPNATIVPKSETKTKWTQSGTPIDTSAFDAEIGKAEKNFKAKSKDEATKKALADAYLKRGVALTESGQYASALGDYRRVQKYDAGNEEAKTWIAKILDIYQMINREAPTEGEEPPPLPFKKEV